MFEFGLLLRINEVIDSSFSFIQCLFPLTDSLTPPLLLFSTSHPITDGELAMTTDGNSPEVSFYDMIDN